MMGTMQAPALPDLVHGTADDLAAASLSLARHFSAGATMWCVAPDWPSHGRHVAVEFVHPVIVGKRALPTVSVDGPDVAAGLRQLVRPGDVLLVVSAADTVGVTDLLLRAGAWGLLSFWLGAGPRPVSPRADHTVWLEAADPVVAARAGDMVLLYHLLWELTHVVLEHRGLIDEPEPAAGADDVCVTCSDEGRITEVRAVLDNGLVEVVSEGRAERVDASLVDRPVPGSLLLVHAGVAISEIRGEAP
jgi:hydrogenase maturation factor